MLTLNQIRKTFKVIADAHKQINGFGFDNEANFGQSNDLEFPCLYVVQEPANISEGQINRPFTCFVLDRYYGDADGADSNLTDVLSDTQLICADIVSLLNNQDYIFTIDRNNIQLEPIYAAEGDLLAGYKLQVTIKEAYDFWRCSVPYEFIVIEQANGTQYTSTNEKDPTVPAYVKAITEAEIANWNTAAGEVSGFVTHDEISGFATTQQLNGYYPSGNPSGFVNADIVSGYYLTTNPSGFVNSSIINGLATTGQLQAYYTTGNPSGFISSYTETDPTVNSIIKAMPVSGSAAPLLWNGSAYALGTRSSTWASRGSGTFTGQIIFITDIGTNGTLFSWNGTRWIPAGPITLLQTASASSVTATTSKVNITSALIPNGLLQATSVIRCVYLWSMTNNANSKLIELAINTSAATGGTVWFSNTLSSTGQSNEFRDLRLANSLTANQLASPSTSTSFGLQGGNPARYNINFNQDVFICVNMQKITSSADSLALESIMIQILF